MEIQGIIQALETMRGTVNALSSPVAKAQDLRTIDLGTIEWSYVTSYGTHPFFFSRDGEIPDLPKTNDFNIVCSGHNVVSGSALATFGNNANNLDIAHNASSATALTGRVFIRNDAYTTASDFKQAMNGVLMVYKV